MNAGNFLNRWKTEFDFRTFVSASFSLAATVLYALFNAFLGIHHAALWNGAICVYYLILILLRGIIIATAKRTSRREERMTERDRVFLLVSFLLLGLNISLVLPFSMMVRLQKPVSMTLIPAIAMAAYTTYKVTMASINLSRRKRSQDGLVWLLRTIGFIDALVSVITLQCTLILVNSHGMDLAILPLSAVTSAVVWMVTLLFSVHAIVKGIRQIKKKD